MSKNSNEFTKLRRAVIREEYVALTGDLEKAVMLNQFIYWSERIKDFDKFVEEERARSENESLEEINIELQNGWIYKDMEELKEEVMFTCSVSTIGRKLLDLVKEGWLSRRRNPRYKWDKRYQYRVDLNKIMKDLMSIGYILQDYRINIAELLKITNYQNECTDIQDKQTCNSCNLQNDSSINQIDYSINHNDKALSKTTTKTTIKTTNQSIKKEKLKDDGLNEILNNCDINSLEDKNQTLTVKAIKVLYYSKKPILSNGIEVSVDDVREDVKALEYKHIVQALNDFKKACSEREITNHVGYLSTCIYNAIFTTDAKTSSRKEVRSNGTVRTKFHNFKQRTSNYTPEELERMVQRKR